MMQLSTCELMSSDDLSCLFCKPKKFFPTWINLKAHLEQHIIEASAKRHFNDGSCNSYCSSCCACASSSFALVPVAHHGSFKKTEDVRKIVGLVRPVIHRSSGTEINPPSTSSASVASGTTCMCSDSSQNQPELSSVVINAKKKWVSAGSSDASSSAPLLFLAAPQVEPTDSEIHASPRVFSVLPLVKKISSNACSEILPSGTEKLLIDGVENIGTLEDTAVLHSSPLTKFSIIHSNAAVETSAGSLSCIKVPASDVGQDFPTNTITSLQEECRDVSCSVSRHSSVPNFHIPCQIPENNTFGYNHANVTTSDSSSVSGMSSLGQGSDVLVKNSPNINQEHIPNLGMVVSPSLHITSTKPNFPSNTKVFHVVGNTTTVSNATSFSKIYLPKSSPLSSTSSVANLCSTSGVGSRQSVAPLYCIPAQKFDDDPKYNKEISDVNFKPNTITSAPAIFMSSSSSCNSAFPSNVHSPSTPVLSGSLCPLEKMSSHCIQHNSHNSSCNVPTMSISSENREDGVTFSHEEEQVDDPLSEDGSSVEKIGLQIKVDQKLKQKCFDCKKCDASFSSRRAALVHHAQIHGKPRAFECRDCGRSFSSSHNLSTHHKHRHGGSGGKHEPALCTVCGKSFASKSNLVLHARLHSGERPFVCPVCDKSFSRKCTLEKHSLYHKGERRYTCERCGAGFYTAHSLSRHIKLHDGERSFACDVCDAKYVVVSDLKRHKLSHAAVKPFSCELCSKTFSRKHDLNVHALYHARSSRFSCEFCDRHFVEESNYKRHLRQHTGEKPYQCNTCGVRYSQLHHMKKHLQTCHREALRTTATESSVTAPLYGGAYSVPHSKSRNRKGYLEKISAAQR